MPRIKFEQLVEIYSSTTFGDGAGKGILSVNSLEIIETLKQIDDDDDAGEDSGISSQTDPATISVGDQVEIQIQPPRIALGVLAEDFDALIRAPGAQIKEPNEYYIIRGGYTKGGKTPPSELTQYRNVLRFVAALADASSYMDVLRQELVFVKDGKYSIPVIFGVTDAKFASVSDIDRLLSYLDDDLHAQQKSELLSTAVISISSGVRPEERFKHLLRNVSILADHLRDGYTLFVSSFSYAKVRNEIDSAKIEYVSKVHKTLADIQGQLLGIPVAAFVVSSQLKPATTCGVELWVNTAVISGAWIFVLMLVLAVVNQWATLLSIGGEIDRQEKKIKKDYSKVAETFGEMFGSVRSRIIWHHVALSAVALIGILSAIFATVIYAKFSSVDVSACLAGRMQIVLPNLS